jgi:cytidyltransferase-like protein
MRVVVAGSFDDLGSRQVRFLEEASRFGEVQVRLWSDRTVRVLEGKDPRFPEAERLYMLQAIRYVGQVALADDPAGPDPPAGTARPCLWVVDQAGDTAGRRAGAASRGLDYRVIPDADLAGFPEAPAGVSPPGRRKVVVTGCYDWLHSGHIRFFEEVAALGELYVVVGHDANVRLLKGEGHPLFTQAERRYMVQAVRAVKRALVSSGQGWMDAEPEIALIRPDLYAVNEDGDKPEKRAFCAAHGIQYVVLERAPRPGLPRRQSTDLRGF